MRNLETTPSLESQEKIEERKKPKSDRELEKQFTVAPHLETAFQDKEQAKALLKKILTQPKKYEDVHRPEISTPGDVEAIDIQALHTKVEKTKRIVTNVADFVPVVGSIKMIMEGLKGEQYGTEKEIKGVERVVHTASGVVFLALDLTGIGAIASELGKGVLKIGERAVIRSFEETLAREVVAKEVTKLTLRGNTRVDKQEKIQRSV